MSCPTSEKAPCCCSCECACGFLRDLWNTPGYLQLTVSGITTDPSSPLTMIWGSEGLVGYEDCVSWKVIFHDASCDIGQIIVNVFCTDDGARMLVTPGIPGGCMLTNLQQDSLTCDDNTFKLRWLPTRPNAAARTPNATAKTWRRVA